MSNPDTLVNVLGILYGASLIGATFFRNGLTEAMRIDALFMNSHSERTRPLNLVVGVLVAGYGAYALQAG